MFCPRCNTELPDDAYACSQCGTVVSAALPAASSSAQAASAFPRVSSAPATFYQPPSFSYLPAGAPQWPAVVPPNIGQMAYAQGLDEAGKAAEDGTQAAQKSARKGTLGAPAILLLFIASILVGGGLTYGLLALGRGNSQAPAPPITLHVGATATAGSGQPSPTATTTNQLPTPTSFLTVSNADVGMSVKYPSDWVLDPTQKSSQSVFIGLHPSQQNGLFIGLQRISTSTSASISNTGMVNDSNLSQLQSAPGVSNFQIVQPATPQQSVGGVQWDEKDATFANQNGVGFHLSSIAVRYKGQYYDILYYAPDSVYNEAMHKYFQPMLTSLKFLS